MLFNSAQFLLFFPAVTLLYFVIPHKVRYLWLLAASYYFYMCWSPRYALLMATSTLITFASGLLISRTRSQRGKKAWVAASFLSNLSILFFFKYFNFFLDSLTGALGKIGVEFTPPAFDVLLPVGISFYTFQALSYTMDVYRKDIAPEKNVLRYALFVSFFPQLVAGPIERSKNLLTQLRDRHTFSATRARDGLLLMLWGYFQKMILADRVAILVNAVYADPAAHTGLPLILAMVFFSVQIYCDFAGYSNIACGAAQVMGFSLMQNFRQPYFATSITDFWRRWHISLSTWFRDYLYIPLGGNRKGTVRKYCNLLLVFLCSGLWHGASWTYVAWGALHGVLQTLGEITKKARAQVLSLLRIDTKCFSWRLLQMGITFVLVTMAWVFFRAGTAAEAVALLKGALAWNPWTLLDGTLYTLGLSRMEFNIALWGITALFAVDFLHERGIHIRAWLARQNTWFRWSAAILAVTVILVFGVYGPNYDVTAFIYFQF